jgi:hypothetical protein
MSAGTFTPRSLSTSGGVNVAVRSATETPPASASPPAALIVSASGQLGGRGRVRDGRDREGSVHHPGAAGRGALRRARRGAARTGRQVEIQRPDRAIAVRGHVALDAVGTG